MSRYVVGSEEMFNDFIEGIDKRDKIGLVTHIDLDGLASGIFLQKILESRGLKIKEIHFMNYETGLVRNLLGKNLDVLFFTDLRADGYPNDLEKLKEKARVLVFDHHPYNEEIRDGSGIIKTKYDYCSSHALFDIASNKGYFDTKKLEWLACAAIISDYMWDKDPRNFEFLKSVYPEIKKDSSIWNSVPGKIGKKINNALIYYSPDIKKVYDMVLKENLNGFDKSNEEVSKEISKWMDEFVKFGEYFPDKKLHFYYGNPKYNLASVVASKLSDELLRETTVIFASDFNGKKGFVKASARDQRGKIDLGKLLKKCVEGLEDGDGGGHPRAASSTFHRADLEKFKERLLFEMDNYRI